MSANFWEQYDQDYTSAEPIVGGTVVPDGEYEVTVTHCAAGESKQKKTPQVQWGFTIDNGPLAGRKLFRDQNITPQGMGFVRGDFEKVFPKGWPLSQCMGALPSLINARLKVKVHTKTGEQYATVYINERLDIAAPPVQPAPAQQPAPAAPAASPAQPALPGIPANNGSPF